MNVIIIGGGHTGAYIAKLLLENGCSVKVIENRESVFHKLREDMEPQYIILGSGTDPETMESAGVAAADVLVAVSGTDETNLVASTIAKYEFGVPRVIARVNNPKNAWLFDAGMGVDVAINQAGLMARLILEGIDIKNMMTLLMLNRGDGSIFQIRVDEKSKAVGCRVRDLAIPEKAVMIEIFRGDDSVIPRGETVIMADDDILALAGEREQAELSKLFSNSDSVCIK